MKPLYVLPRALLMLTIAAVLLGGLAAGLARLGWNTDAFDGDFIMAHGPLMICGVLGTLICLERAVALAARYRWSMAVPAVNAAGAAVLLLAGNSPLARTLLMLGSLGLALLFVLMVRLRPSRDLLIMAAGALCWLAGNVMWQSGAPVYRVVHLWTAFLVLTIVGERLELSRVRRLTPASEMLLTLAASIYLSGVVLTIYNLEIGTRLLGAGALLLAGWLLRYDVARRTVYQRGLPRFIAVCLLAGYVWLGFGGAMALVSGMIVAGPDYAIVLHAFLLGFVFSMIFGHAPIILPAVTGKSLDYTPAFYGHLAVLHVTLAYRTFGSLAGDFAVQQHGGLLNAIAIVLFLGVTLVTAIRSNR